MSCPHAQTTTLLWLYGEADPATEQSHLEHVAGCDDCTAVIDAHEQVQHAVAPVAGAMQTATPQVAVPLAANRPWFAVAIGLAVAAAALLFVVLQPVEQAPAADTDLAVLAEPASLGMVDPPLFGELDAGLEALDLELADFSSDLTTL